MKTLYDHLNCIRDEFANALVEGKSAEIVDWGYESAEALAAAWQGTAFENRGDCL